MELRLNLSTSPRENKRPFLAGAGVLGMIALILLLVLSHQAYQSWRANRDIRRNIADLERQIQASEQKQGALEAYFRTPEAVQVLDRSGFLNSLIDERSFPWTKVFADLESTIPPGVRVISLTPKLVDGRAEITLQIGVNSNESEIKFLQSLEKSSAFTGITVNQVRPTDQPTTT